MQKGKSMNKQQLFTKELVTFIRENPCSYFVIDHVKRALDACGFQQLLETECWELNPQGAYYVIRNDASLIAFRGLGAVKNGIRIIAAHSDSPSFKVKQNPEMNTESYIKLNVEKYGGMILSTWLDRGLSVAGRVFVKRNDQIERELVNVDRTLLVIPNLAIHMNREINKGIEYNPQTDMLPLFASDMSQLKLAEIEPKLQLEDIIATQLGVSAKDILSMDLYLYNRDEGMLFGSNEEFVISPRLDEQQCVFAAMKAMTDTSVSKESDYCQMIAVFDNEEVGSCSMQGADSSFLESILLRIKETAGLSEQEYQCVLAKSFLLSADNAHALHPNHPEKNDPTNKPVLNGGIVLKFQANQKYTTDAKSAAYIQKLCQDNNLRCQTYHNKSDINGGGTLGNLAISHVSIPAADVGCPQLAMHSALETASVYDTCDMYELMKACLCN